MKVFMATAVLSFLAASANASVIIHEYNVSHDATTFIESEQTGKHYDATQQGSLAVIADKDLKGESGNEFSVGITEGATKLYCQNASQEQFTFKYDAPDVVVKNSLIHMNQDKQGLHCTLIK